MSPITAQLLPHMCICEHQCAYAFMCECSQSPEEGTWCMALSLRVVDLCGWKPRCECQGLISGPLHDQEALLTTELCLQPCFLFVLEIRKNNYQACITSLLVKYVCRLNIRVVFIQLLVPQNLPQCLLSFVLFLSLFLNPSSNCYLSF